MLQNIRAEKHLRTNYDNFFGVFSQETDGNQDSAAGAGTSWTVFEVQSHKK